MTLDFNTFNLTQKAEGGGGSGTTNHAQLSNLDYANAGHTGFLSNENFIPANTIITVELDGTGDYTKLSDAIEFLINKWSTGVVTIQLGEGVFTETEQINISSYNIPIIEIKGKSTALTTLKDGRTATTGVNRLLFKLYGSLLISNLTIEGVGTSLTNYRCLDDADNYSLGMLVNDVTIKNCGIAIATSGYLSLGGTITINNCIDGIMSSSGNCKSNWSPTFNFDTATNAFKVQYGGQIHLMGATCNYTNVTNRTNQTVGTATNNGWITGVTV